MKQFLILLLILYFTMPVVFAKNETNRPSLDARQENYISLENLNLNERELEKFNKIYIMEYNILRPISLKLEANLLRLDELNEIKCRWYQKQCKKELKKNKDFIAGDIKELKRQVSQKKEYFKILYINETTRAQHYALREIIKKITNDKTHLW